MMAWKLCPLDRTINRQVDDSGLADKVFDGHEALAADWPRILFFRSTTSIDTLSMA